MLDFFVGVWWGILDATLMFFSYVHYKANALFLTFILGLMLEICQMNCNKFGKPLTF